ncbi:MAG TPA: lipocalin-like domain-containing protein [Bryobacteraceae bacterium]|nr:lipocalin-like domain-containing protein [Bryobacteraceae bacterium]
MKKLAAILVFAGLASVTAGEDRGGALTGAWRLSWLEQPGADGKPHRADSSGLLVFTADGHMSVQVMETRPAPEASAPEQYSQGGYEASWGTYKIDNRAHTFTFHVEGALVRALIGKYLPRAYELSGEQLIVKSTRADEHWRVGWERY